MGPSAPAERHFSREEIERARAYHRPLYASFAASAALGVGYLAAVTSSAAGRWLAAPVDDLSRWAFAAAFPALVVVAGAVLRFPLSFWRGYVHEHRWGFSTQSPAGFVSDWAMGLAVSVALTGAAVMAFVELASRFPRTWRLIAAPAAAGLAVVLSFLAPVVFEPMFNRFRPLADEQLAADLRALSRRAGVPVREVLVADASRRTHKENAYVSGLGRTRRVVVYDTLLARGSPQEVRLVVAHELGHRRERHVALATALGAAGAAVAVVVLWLLLRWHPVLAASGATGPADPRIAPLLLLAATAMELVTLPFGAAVSRRWEAAADRASIELTGDPDGFAGMERNLAVANLLDLAPSRPVYLLLFSHPTPAERIEAAMAGG
ncbi:MAG: M48 family metalloprotease [Actinomycetota bacterium]|nr:M48 family metalloprotease [Actinomycetota bacterium]